MTVSIPTASPPHLSYSQLGSYAECPRKWYLSRRERVPQNTWFATLAGKAIHSATEEADALEWSGLGLDLASTKTRFAELFDEQLAEAKVKGEEVRPSGRETKSLGWSGGPKKKDEAWWRQFGPLMIEQWFDWRSQNGLKLHEIDGGPAIEIPLDFELIDSNGEALRIKAFIDRVYKSRIGGILTVFDLKTGAVPSTGLQVETYGVGLHVQYGHKARYGAFWQPGAPKEGEAGYRVYGPTKLHHNVDILADIYHSARKGIEAGAFPPNTRNNCMSCGVNKFCTAWNGEQAIKELDKWREANVQHDSDSDAEASLPHNGKDTEHDD